MPEKNRRGRPGRPKKAAAEGLSARDEAQLLMEAQEELNLAWRAASGLEAEEFGVAPEEKTAPAAQTPKGPQKAARSTGTRSRSAKKAAASETKSEPAPMAQPKAQKKQKAEPAGGTKRKAEKLRIIPLGGLLEVGKTSPSTNTATTSSWWTAAPPSPMRTCWALSWSSRT